MLRTSTHRRRHALLAVGAAFGLVLGACSSDSKTGATTTPVTTATTTAATAGTTAATTASSESETTAGSTASTDTATSDTASTDTATSETATASSEVTASSAAGSAADKSPVLIAGIIDATGPSAGDQGNAEPIAKAWADYVNSKGGLDGHPVTFEFADNGGDAAKAQSQIAELEAKNPVAFLLLSTGVESSLGEALTASGIPVIGVGYSPAIWGGSIEAFKLACSTDAGAPVACAIPNAFPVTTTFGAVVDEQVIGAKAAGATKLATAACAEVDSCSQAEPVFAADATALGLTDTGVVKVSSTASDYTAECIKFVQDGVDFIQISAAGSVGATMWGNCQDQGYTGIFGASAGSVAGDLIKIPGITLAGGINAFPWWVDDAPVKEYRDVLTAAGITEDQYSSPTMTGVWGDLQLFAKANAKLSDNPTKDETLANMYTISNETLDGLIAPVTFTKGQLGANRPCFWPYILKDGTFTNPLGGLKYECYPPES
ncbi:MAG: branched-chain amino acid transporter periplasmic protein [Ilumatobacteraceae bacterium]|nr:branched-chain amino acid transporter periplasmic protein [Ilumatobacteraceae bacterium]